MFTVLAFIGITLIAWKVSRKQDDDTDNLEINTMQVRQDMRLVAYLLAGILVMLGVISDRIH